MDRMQERTAREESRPAEYSEAVNICQNCHQAVERLTLVPEFLYMGCDDCMEEALAVIAREALELPRREMLTEAGCTPAETAAFIREVA